MVIEGRKENADLRWKLLDHSQGLALPGIEDSNGD